MGDRVPVERLTPRERQVRRLFDRVEQERQLKRFRRRLRQMLVAALILNFVVMGVAIWHGAYASLGASLTAIPICCLGWFFLRFAEWRDGG